MDIADIRSLVTAASFVLFIGLVVLAWLPSRRAEHDEAAHLPFSGEAETQR